MTNYNIPKELPCCGVAVLCYILDRNFKSVFIEIRDFFHKNDAWYGGMSLSELLLVLIDNDYDFEEYDSDQTLVEFCEKNQDVRIVNTEGHFQIVKGTKIFDQKGWYDISHAENKKIVKIIKNISKHS